MMRQRPAANAGYNAGAGTSQDYYAGYQGAAASSGGYSYSQQSTGGYYSQQSTGGGSEGYGGYSGSQSNYGGYAPDNSAYGGYVSPSSSDSKYSKKSSKKASSVGSVIGSPLVLVCVLMLLWSIAVLGLWMNVRAKYQSILREFNAPNSSAVMKLFTNLQSDLSDAQKEKARKIRETTSNLNVQQEELKRENRLLQKEYDELRIKYEGPDSEDKTFRMVQREEAFKQQMHLLQESIRKESRRTVLERFGPGPHEVEFKFKIDEEDRSFVVELAPLDQVPHAVHLFMEQVEHGLWDGCYFYLNGPHVIQAGPQLSEADEADTPSDDEDDDRSLAMAPFKSAGLDQLSFPDYSDNFPHTTWTLGYTGRPGGVDWYINKIDNSKSHGPGGQSQHALDEQGDPCFGKITRGQNHAAVLFQQPVYGDQSEWHYFLEDPVEIIEAKILTKRPEVATAHHKVDENNAGRSPHGKAEKRKPRLPKIDQAAEP